MIVSKEISVSSRPFKVCGYESDPYFRDIEVHLQHGFLVPLLAHFLKPGSRIIDVGANIGGTTALMHKFVPQADIVSIEPSRMFACLKATIAANAFTGSRCAKLCVGRDDGEVSFVDCGDYQGNLGTSASHSHIAFNGARGEKLPLRSLDSIAREMGIHKLDLVKIDVEGFEEGVLEGMSRINDAMKPMIFMEFNAYTLAVHAKTSPYAVLERIRDRFGGFIAMRDERPVYVQSDDALGGFYFDNMTKNGCVEDIVFSASPDLRSAFAL